MGKDQTTLYTNDLLLDLNWCSTAGPPGRSSCNHSWAMPLGRRPPPRRAPQATRPSPRGRPPLAQLPPHRTSLGRLLARPHVGRPSRAVAAAFRPNDRRTTRNKVSRSISGLLTTHFWGRMMGKMSGRWSAMVRSRDSINGGIVPKIINSQPWRSRLQGRNGRKWWWQGGVRATTNLILMEILTVDLASKYKLHNMKRGVKSQRSYMTFCYGINTVDCV